MKKFINYLKFAAYWLGFVLILMPLGFAGLILIALIYLPVQLLPVEIKEKVAEKTTDASAWIFYQLFEYGELMDNCLKK